MLDWSQSYEFDPKKSRRSFFVGAMNICGGCYFGSDAGLGVTEVANLDGWLEDVHLAECFSDEVPTGCCTGHKKA